MTEGTDIRCGDWIYDRLTGFAMRAHALRASDEWVSADETGTIRAQFARRFDPRIGAQLDDGRSVPVARPRASIFTRGLPQCDEAAYDQATRRRHLGQDRKNIPVYEDDWLRDALSGFVMRAHRHANACFLSDGLVWCIKAENAERFEPTANSPWLMDSEIAHTDREAYRAALKAVPTGRAASPDAPSVFEKLDWL